MLETGKSYTQEIIVGPKDTALAHGSGHLEVFATPAMVGLMENTAIHCLEGMLEPDTLKFMYSIPRQQPSVKR